MLRAQGRAPAGSGADDEIETVRRYRRVARDSWHLEEVRQIARVTDARGSRLTETITRITYGAWNRDQVKDSLRGEAPRLRVDATPRVSTAAPLSRAFDVPADAPTAPSDVLFGLCDRGTAEANIARSKSSHGLSIVYQHGFCADASVWDGVRPLIASAHPVVRERAFSIQTTAAAEDQVTELRTRILETDTRPNLVIGHSLGGLLARRLGQRDPALVTGVITIGSPNGGARIAQIGPDAAAEIMEQAAGRYCVGSWLCNQLVMLAADQQAGKLLFGAPGLLPPVLQDLSPSSGFLRTLNSTPEPFPRAGIEVDAGNRWAVFRMLGDARTPRTRVLTGQRPSGHSWVSKAEETYRTAQLLQFFSFFAHWSISAYGAGIDCTQSGYAAFWTPCLDQDWYSMWIAPWYLDLFTYLVYQLSTFLITAMDFVDHSWDWLTTGNVDRTDGLVALQAQRYPNAPGAVAPVRVLITPPDADSHAGETARASTASSSRFSTPISRRSLPRPSCSSSGQARFAASRRP
jgi:pimeloyl-ACP methyl ester carboxylesterase